MTTLTTWCDFLRENCTPVEAAIGLALTILAPVVALGLILVVEAFV